jgi:hypothetical protein
MKTIFVLIALSFLAILPAYAMDDPEVLPTTQVIVPAVTGKSFEVLRVEFDKDSAIAFIEWKDDAGNALSLEHVHLLGSNYDNSVKWVIASGNVDKTLRKIMINKITKEIKTLKGLQ